jgi:hypothetical protein
LETGIGDFLGSGMDLAVVISKEFLVEKPLGLLDLGHLFSDTGSDQAVLKPAIRPFNFSPGLRRKRVDHLHVAIFQNLFPLGSGLIGQEVMLIPEGVSASDKAEDGVGIDVIGIRESISEENGLQGQDMGPAGLFSNQDGIEEEAAVIIEGSNEIPFLLGGRCPQMMGRIMLDQFPGIAG